MCCSLANWKDRSISHNTIPMNVPIDTTSSTVSNRDSIQYCSDPGGMKGSRPSCSLVPLANNCPPMSTKDDTMSNVISSEL